MKIETNESLTAICLELYSRIPSISAADKDRMLQEALETNRMILEGISIKKFDPASDLGASEWDLELAKFAMYIIQSHSGRPGYPTEAHRIWDAVRTAIGWTRQDERGRIAAAIRADVEKSIGPTATGLIGLNDSCDCG